MKGKLIYSLDRYDGKTVWVKFENPDAASCENCGACGPRGPEERIFPDGLYQVDGQFLISLTDKSLSVHECSPRIQAIYEEVT